MVRLGEPTLTGAGLGRDVVRRIVRRHINRVRGCYDWQLAHAPDLSGSVTVRWVIERDGAVTGSELEASTLASATVDDGGASALAVTRCIVESVATWVYPAPEGAPVHVSYPFFLAPASTGDIAGAPGSTVPAATEPGSAAPAATEEGLGPSGTGRGGS